MRAAISTLAALMLAGCDGMFAPSNVFDVPISDAYGKVASSDISKVSKTFLSEASVTRKPVSSVAWSHEGLKCDADFVKLDESKTQIDVSCSAGEYSLSNPMTGMTLALMRKEIIEFIDSAITDRPFDPRLARGATASGWPADKIEHGGIHEAQSEALAMAAEAKREQAEYERNNP